VPIGLAVCAGACGRDEVAAGHIDAVDAGRALAHTIPRVFGVHR